MRSWGPRLRLAGTMATLTIARCSTLRLPDLLPPKDSPTYGELNLEQLETLDLCVSRLETRGRARGGTRHHYAATAYVRARSMTKERTHDPCLPNRRRRSWGQGRCSLSQGFVVASPVLSQSLWPSCPRLRLLAVRAQRTIRFCTASHPHSKHTSRVRSSATAAL